MFRHVAAGFSTILWTWPLLPVANALSFTSVSQPDLDLSSLGRVTIVGNFDTASLYSYTEQSGAYTVNNGSQSLLTPLPNGYIADLSAADSRIVTLCSLAGDNGTNPDIFVGGSFTSLGGIESRGIAQFNPNSGKVTAIPGLNGSVSVLLCDQDTNSVYVGGDFKQGNSSNAIVWNADQGWSNLPFDGFNGPVASILKETSSRIIFGGSFDGLGNSTSSREKSQQIINLQNATISSDANSALSGYQDPRNIICQTTGEDGPGKTWLLNDHSPGYWRAETRFGFRPTKLRLYNTHLDGRGTKSFLLRALPDNGIMNLTYSDPSSGKDVFCDSICPLSDNSSEIYRDFKFVNNIGMGGIQIEISDWYGTGAGLDGIELFEDEIMTYAINGSNEPACAGIDYRSAATQQGSWTVTTVPQGQSDYLTAQVTDSNAASTSVTFEPDIKQSGNYSVILYTPGCIQDGTCNVRGIVNVTGTFSNSEFAKPIQTNIYQTNYYDKYDTIYTGHVDASSSSFRPSVTLKRLAGQGDISIVASVVRFDSISATGGLNGLYGYTPSAMDNNSSDFIRSPVDRAGTQLSTGASILKLVQNDGVLYAGGNFSDSNIHNIMFFNGGNATALPQGGLNSEVNSMLVSDNLLYVGGSFTDTADGGNDDMKHIAAYSLTSRSWSPLGGGVNGPVNSILSFPLNVSSEINETTIAVSGDFDQILAFGNNTSASVSGFAIWVPSQKNWLQNLNVSQSGFVGQLTAMVSMNDTNILAGNLSSDGLVSNGAVSLLYSNGLSLSPFSTGFDRIKEGGEIFTGIVDKSSGCNSTILGGRFTASALNGSTVENLLILNGKDASATGLGTEVNSNSTFLALAVTNNTLFAGGVVTGTVGESALNGFVLYDLSSGQLVENQPPSFHGDNVYVNSIAVRPGSTEVYFGGSFDAAGALPCPGVCFYDMSSEQWNGPGVELTGTVLSLEWASDKELVAVGNLTVSNNQTFVATYNTKSQTWSSFDGASSANIPGTVTAFTPAREDVSNFWLAGQSSNGSSFLVNYDGSRFQSPGNLFEDGTTIRGLEVLTTSKSHGSTPFLDDNLVLLVAGQLVIPNFGNASAALFNGSTLSPFILTASSNGEPGSIARVITEQKNTYHEGKHHHSNGIVVLVSFCLALGCVFLIVVAGVILNKIQRRRQGYMRAPQSYGTDRRPSAMNRLPPEYLFNSLQQTHPGAPAL